MSGHSKWATIKRQKGVADVKRGNLFTKLANTITVAARSGDGNPETNFRLRLAIDKAKAASMPKDNIERAVKRGTGELGGAQIEEVVYEGYGPGGIAILVETLTDNKNRTGPVIRNIFSKHGGNMGNIGSVAWMFEQKGVIRLDLSAATKPKDEIELSAIDAGAQDVREGNGDLTILCANQDLEALKKTLEEKGIPVEYAEVEYIASTPMSVSDAKAREQLDALYADLDNCDDVNNYYTNET
ncbi:MAG TPA: YebC/PmpR family DNA-binding transcriptional regulator [Patescibacteria group bacterium]|nr:YebC/PmpR family DNA-binding transcriptional regulator [Patescibacteria group bacterium]